MHTAPTKGELKKNFIERLKVKHTVAALTEIVNCDTSIPKDGNFLVKMMKLRGPDDVKTEDLLEMLPEKKRADYRSLAGTIAKNMEMALLEYEVKHIMIGE